MTRQWLRLIAWSSLVALVAANPGVAAALAASLRPDLPRSARPCDLATAPAHPGGPRAKCKHCAKKMQDAPSSGSRAALHEGQSPCGPSCPGCPSCPVPGGCAHCNLAKVPCLPPAPSGPAATHVVVYALAEAAAIYTSPSLRGLSRPPKA